MDIDNLLQLEEGQKLDFKRVKIKPSDLLDLVVGFANAGGGKIILGLADKKEKGNRLFGICENEALISEVKKLIPRDIDPSIVNYTEEYYTIINNNNEEDKICILTIDKAIDIVSKRNGDTFLRKGDQNVKIGASEIIKLKYERGSASVEGDNSNIDDLDCLDMDILNIFKKDNNSLAVDNWQFLKDQGLVVRINNKNYLTKGAILLFGKNPAVTLGMKNSIKISRYYGNEITYSGTPNLVHKPITIEGPLLNQIGDTMHYFNDLRNSYSPVLKDSGFVSSYLIPDSAFREAVTNAVIHRNYELQNDIQVRFFDNRVEIDSPGTYPRDITPKNIRLERFCRNPKIQRGLNKFSDSPNLDIGEGVDRMFLDMEKNNLYQPIYMPASLRPNSVFLVLINERKIEYWDMINNYLENNNFISNSLVRSITGLDTLKTSRLLSGFVKKGLLEMVNMKGDKRNIIYVRKDNDISLSQGVENETVIGERVLKNKGIIKGSLSKGGNKRKK